VTTRVAVVTGAGSGIGAATAAVLAREGFAVACLDLDGAAAERVADGLGAAHFGLAVDVGDEPAVVAAFEAVGARYGRIDALATCAGITDTTPFMDATAEQFMRVYRVNAVGTFLCIREAVRRMERGARICTVSSVAGLRGGGLFGQAAYSASKGAVLALTRNAARAFAERGIAVNGVCPASIATPMMTALLEDDAKREALLAGVPLGRLAAPEEAAEAIAWLLSPRASYVHGETLIVDGGIMMQ